jgi:hypothetical protein
VNWDNGPIDEASVIVEKPIVELPDDQIVPDTTEPLPDDPEVKTDEIPEE